MHSQDPEGRGEITADRTLVGLTGFDWPDRHMAQCRAVGHQRQAGREDGRARQRWPPSSSGPVSARRHATVV